MNAEVRTDLRSWAARRLPYLYLVYLLLYPLPWFGRSPSSTAVVAFATGVAIFLPVYFYSYRTTNPGRLACAATTLAIGFALQPFGGVWGVFAVYAAAMIGYVRPTRHALQALVALAIAVVIFAFLRNVRTFDWLSTVFFGAIVGLG